MTFIMRSLLSCLLLLALVSQARAAIVYSVTLDGPSESPANTSPGTGTGTVTFDGNTMRVQASFSGLLSLTGAGASSGVTASHIHAATSVAGAGTAGVATQTPTFVGFPLGVQSGTYDTTFDMTLASSFNPTYVTNNGGTTTSAFAALQLAAADGKAYLNIHTNAFTGGEIRGFLTAVPEPACFYCLACVAMPIFFGRNRKQGILIAK